MPVESNLHNQPQRRLLLWTCIWIAAAIVLVYIFLDGLTSAIYNEVLQFFMNRCALPWTVAGTIRLSQASRTEAVPLGKAGFFRHRARLLL